MRLLDLFSGIGGFARGIEQAGIKIEEHYYSEIDKYAEAIYRRHYPRAQPLGAVADVRGDKYEPFDLITFGFPCQDISVAGKRKGLQGARSNLFFEAARIIRENKPRAFIFENVKGLFSSNGGKDFITVLREIADIGLYECQWQLLNTSWFLPQNRERIYLIGHLAGTSIGQIFPIGEGSQFDVNESREEPSGKSRVSTLDSRYGQRWSGETYVQGGVMIESHHRPQGERVQSEERSPLIDHTPHYLKAVPLKYLNRNQKNYQGDYSFTVDSVNTGGVSEHGRIRRLTPTECARLQGFPDNWCEQGIDEDGDRMDISDAQQYKCYGNAVSTVVVEAIMRKWNF